ncbi:N-6 DNA methylase [Nonomuraea sp. NPDC049758]|uniref:N-6 DNA methylase n=1 Tax=Nonomuraea sp. NPDC049758 TaxID=3154360 RepID=UPI003437502E
MTQDLFPDEIFDVAVANPPFNLSRWDEDGRARYDPRWAYGVPPAGNASSLSYGLAAGAARSSRRRQQGPPTRPARRPRAWSTPGSHEETQHSAPTGNRRPARSCTGGTAPSQSRRPGWRSKP